jgi:hypothetical protein
MGHNGLTIRLESSLKPPLRREPETLGSLDCSSVALYSALIISDKVGKTSSKIRDMSVRRGVHIKEFAQRQKTLLHTGTEKNRLDYPTKGQP